MDTWLDTLTHRGAQRDAYGRLLAFADEPLPTSLALLTPLARSGALRLTGPDRHDFLHGQISNEVKRLAPGQTNTALLLNHRGQAQALMRVHRRPDDLFVTVEDGATGVVERELRAHIIFDQVELANLSDTLASFTLQGAEVGGILVSLFGQDLPEPGSFKQLPFNEAEVLVAPARRTTAGDYDLHVLARDAVALFDTLVAAGAQPAGERTLEMARVAAGIPTVAGELAAGGLPQEAGLAHAVSYTKGCYLGQEIMARIEARGNVRRSLRGLRLEHLPPEGVTTLTRDGKKVGDLGTVVTHPEFGVIALAVVRSEVAVGERLELAGVTATVSELPFAAT